MAHLFSTLFYALRYNLMGILFFAAALWFAHRGKTFWHWYIIGALVQGYSILGTLMGIFMEPETWRTPGNYAAVLVFAILALGVFLDCHRQELRYPSQQRKADPMANAEKQLKEQRKQKKSS